MTIHHSEKIILESGTLNLENLPFKKGDVVEVIIIERSQTSINLEHSSLEGRVIRYDAPFESATDLDDWEALSYSKNL
ncbi:hypothetical protein [Chroococcus sp. FPU101]|uniref:hypothetical protein n=1 Tax=Chroococcus sp. FPU101 TaxID=1974212 RepID=UPI001A8CA2DB|nr:hypothetical protein [Chroococcus sp. FPU101]GFE68077.1 hypothetical protein CFPU101_06870 [Chroococcus sp. FPU101]